MLIPRTESTLRICKSDVERFAKYVGAPDANGCRVWVGSRMRCRGVLAYGHFRLDGEKHGAHRVAWVIANGRSIPRGMIVCHRCDNPPCVEPSHLFLGTHLDNSRDKIRKGRAYHPSGVDWVPGRPAYATAKLTRAQVDDVRRQRAKGAKLKHLAARYGIAISAVHNVCVGKTYRRFA